jgi:hypothetical protein
MKIRCEVTAVETNGDRLNIRMQGQTLNAANWRGWERQEISIPVSKTSQRTFYVGRIVEITVKPR